MKSNIAINSKIIGLCLFVAGALASIALHMGENQNDGIIIYAYAAIVVGLLIFIGGMFYSLAYQIYKPKSIHQDDRAIAASTLIRCMIAICIADGDLDEREIKTIVKVYKQLTNSAVTEETVQAAAEDMHRQETDITEELKGINEFLHDELRSQILKASLLILAADGAVDQREEEMLEEIRKGLGFSKRKLERAKERFFTDRGMKPAES